MFKKQQQYQQQKFFIFVQVLFWRKNLAKHNFWSIKAFRLTTFEI